MSANVGGVRNLRAMFENKTSDQSNSPPSRGRSPSGSVASANSRQVSKVRASFVAVERPGDLAQGSQWGLRKASDVSSMAEVREDSTHPFGSPDGRVGQEQVPKSPHTATHSIDGGLGSILKGSAFEGSPSGGVESKVSASSEKAESKPNGVASRAAAMLEKMKSNDNPQAPPVTALKSTPTAHPVKPPNPKHMPATQPPSTKTNSPKTPTSPVATKMNIKGGPAKIRGVMESARKAGESRDAVKKDQATRSPVTSKIQPSPKSSAPATLPSAVTATTATSQGHKTASEQAQKPARTPRTSAVSAKFPSTVTASTAASEAHKTEETKLDPKTRTSAVPGRLPSAATAKTTASAMKSDKDPAAAAMKQRHSQSRSSMASAGRPTKIPSAATAGTASTLAKKSSRASLANGERPRSRLSSVKPDESFLARMARPTVSSASKTHDKPEVPKTKAASRHARKSDQSHTTTSDEAVVGEAAVTPEAEHPIAKGSQEDATPSQTELAGVHANGSLPSSNPATVESNA